MNCAPASTFFSAFSISCIQRLIVHKRPQGTADREIGAPVELKPCRVLAFFEGPDSLKEADLVQIVYGFGLDMIPG